jgi:hypothetical protein
MVVSVREIPKRGQPGGCPLPGSVITVIATAPEGLGAEEPGQVTPAINIEPIRHHLW